jgi:signal transduction histidine kinase
VQAVQSGHGKLRSCGPHVREEQGVNRGVRIRDRTAAHRQRHAPGAARAAADIARVEQDVDLDYALEHVPRALDRALDGLNRVATIVNSMRMFAHPDVAEMTEADLNQGIQSTIAIARNEYKYVADVETDFGEIPPVMCHAGDINQAILNIIVNAAHAIADEVRGTEKRGRIAVRTRQDGDSVVVSISDTGGGIPQDVRDRVFDPFFTTKEVGRGTGQGLTIARAVVVDKHRGELTFQTGPEGTTFFVRLLVAGCPPQASR